MVDAEASTEAAVKCRNNLELFKCAISRTRARIGQGAVTELNFVVASTTVIDLRVELERKAAIK